MYEDNLTHDKPFRKSATTVGNVLGRYHPHGDAAVYGTMVRMAQDFSLRYTLVEGHGNFGNVDGDGAAAYRYTEARMSKIADYMLDRLIASYNEGRKINSDRYDEICRVLAAMLSSTQTVVSNSDVGSGIDDKFYYIEQTLTDRMRAIALPSIEEVEDITARVDARAAQWLASREADINRQFDARLEQSKAQMVANGTYNSVVWPSVMAGIEKERQYALSNLASAMGELESAIAQIKEGAYAQKMSRVELAQKVETTIAEMRSNLNQARLKVISEVVNNKVNLATLRNNAATALVKVMEERSDEYPDLETILEVVTRLDNQSADPGGGLNDTGAGHNTQTVLPDPTLPEMNIPELPAVDTPTLPGK
jgi:hypothetical protein